MQPYEVILYIKKYWLGLTVLFVIVIAFIFVSSFGFVDLQVSGESAQKNTTYTLQKQGSNDKTIVNASTGSTRKLIRKGRYEVVTQQGDRGYFSFVNVKGFLGTSKLVANPSPQNSRVFVGDNPGTCVYLSGGILHTYSCGGTLSSIQTHKPALAAQPTYISKNTLASDGVIGGVVPTKQGTVALVTFSDVEASESGDIAPPAHALYLLGANGGATKFADLSGLENNTTYSMKAYKDGFVIFDTSLTVAYYFSSIDAKPTNINLEGPKDSSLRPFGLVGIGDSVVTTFSNADEFEDAANGKVDEVNTEVIVKINDSYKHFTVNERPTGVAVCGNEKLCVLTGNNFTVYDASSEDLKEIYTVGNVDRILSLNSRLLLIRSNEIVDFDVEKQSGSVSYNLGEYVYCGAHPDIGGYLLCIASPDGKRSELFVSNTASDTDAVDKKIVPLSDLEEVSTFSVYKNLIFISPDFGDMVYNSSAKTYEYNPVTKGAIINTINQRIDELGIDRKKYQITIVGAQ